MSFALACRPPIPGEGSPGPSSIAGNLVTSIPVTVIVHLPASPNALSAPFVYAQAAESIAAANVTLDFTTPNPGEPIFSSRTNSDRVDLFVATSESIAVAGTEAEEFVRIASFQQRSDFELIVPTASKIKKLSDLVGKRVYVDGSPGDDAVLLSALSASGIDVATTTITYSEDLSTPFDPMLIFDGSHDAALVHRWDGTVRAAQGFDAEGNAIGESGIRTLEIVNTQSSSVGSYSLWVDRRALESPDLVTALAATLIGVASGLDSCMRMTIDCAQALADSGLADQSPETLTWAIQHFLDSVFPAINPIFSLAPSEGNDDSSVLARAEGNWPAALDRIGADWQHTSEPMPLE